jgi:RNA polymerase sigma-70 factor (ECF subfamily)
MPNAEPQDALIVVRCQLGHEDAWRQLVERWQPRLWSFIARMTPDSAAAEDVLQTVWLRVIRSLVRLREPERWSAWVYGIARAAIIDRFRDQYRRPATEVLADISFVDTGAEQLADKEFLATELNRLCPMDREAVVLHYLQELPVADVAEICGVPAGTIKSRLHRARHVLRQNLQP